MDDRDKNANRHYLIITDGISLLNQYTVPCKYEQVFYQFQN